MTSNDVVISVTEMTANMCDLSGLSRCLGEAYQPCNIGSPMAILGVCSL